MLSIKKNNEWFQYAVTKSHEEIGKHSERITKNERFINKYNWEGINFLSRKNDWKKFVKNNLTIALNVLYATYVSKNNSNLEKQVILLMIPNVGR